jgi:hypothetical protein
MIKELVRVRLRHSVSSWTEQSREAAFGLSSNPTAQTSTVLVKMAPLIEWEGYGIFSSVAHVLLDYCRSLW